METQLWITNHSVDRFDDYVCTDKGLRGLREFKKSGSKCKSITQMHKIDKNNFGCLKKSRIALTQFESYCINTI